MGQEFKRASFQSDLSFDTSLDIYMYLYRYVDTIIGVLFTIFSIQASATADVDMPIYRFCFANVQFTTLLNAVIYVVFCCKA